MTQDFPELYGPLISLNVGESIAVVDLPLTFEHSGYYDLRRRGGWWIITRTAVDTGAEASPTPERTEV